MTLILSLPITAMPVKANCKKISSSPISYLCHTKNLYRYKFPPLWLVKDSSGRVVDTTYGWNSVEIYPQSGLFYIEIYHNGVDGVGELIMRSETANAGN